MKTLLTWCFALTFAGVFAQSGTADRVDSALGKGDAAGIGAFLVASVDLTILSDENIYPKDQVVRKLAAFFKQNPPSSFEVKHQGKSKLDDHYRIGDLKTSKGTFRVTYFMKKEGNGMMIKQLRIEPY
jgi:hypothetical protein